MTKAMNWDSVKKGLNWWKDVCSTNFHQFWRPRRSTCIAFCIYLIQRTFKWVSIDWPCPLPVLTRPSLIAFCSCYSRLSLCCRHHQRLHLIHHVVCLSVCLVSVYSKIEDSERANENIGALHCVQQVLRLTGKMLTRLLSYTLCVPLAITEYQIATE